MLNCKSLLYCLSVLLLGMFVLTSCSKAKGSASAVKLEVADIRIGTGQTNIEIGSIVFNADEKIIITYDLKNIATINEAVSGKGISYYWIRQDLVIRDKQGNIVLLKPGIIYEKEPIYSKPLKFKNIVELPGVGGIKPGKYIVTLLVTDLIDFETTKAEIPIKIK